MGLSLPSFAFKLEYNRSVHYEMEEAAYHEVARLDHNVAPNRGHDIREEGIHMDLFREQTTSERCGTFHRIHYGGRLHNSVESFRRTPGLLSRSI